MTKSKKALKRKNSSKKRNEEKVLKRRLLIFLIVIIILFTMIFFRLFQVMILDNGKYKKTLKKLNYTIVEGSSAPRGRIYDRNYNILVDNKAIKTIYYKKSKGLKTEDEIELAYTVSGHLSLDISKLSDDAKRSFYLAKYPDKLKKRITEEEWQKYQQRRLTAKEIEKLKLDRITDDELNSFSEMDNKAAYLYYLMNKGYTYEEKTIKTGEDLSEEEYAYIAMCLGVFWGLFQLLRRDFLLVIRLII